MSRKVLGVVEDITRELDLVVFRLERAPPDEPGGMLSERRALRRELEQLRDRLTDLSRDLDT